MCKKACNDSNKPLYRTKPVCVYVRFPGYYHKEYAYLCDRLDVDTGSHCVVSVRGEYKVVQVTRVVHRVPAIASSWIVDVVDTNGTPGPKKQKVVALQAKLDELAETLESLKSEISYHESR